MTCINSWLTKYQFPLSLCMSVGKLLLKKSHVVLRMKLLNRETLGAESEKCSIHSNLFYTIYLALVHLI